ncbi:diguanylate cyclase [Undibacterium terreum]|uniref:diguanylate cyclase n=1 Tax=Undibacterium terreum TaxID=1224302 RepID=UPI00166BC789|nr:diguanylate cyclase [Undibacterium terreum]
MTALYESYEYDIVERLHVSDRSLVYRALSAQGKFPVIVKIPSKDFPSFQEVAQFKREYAIARRCEHEGIVRPIALRQVVGRWTMMQEDIGGQSLQQLLREYRASKQELETQTAIPLADFFDIALQLCDALEVVHANHIIHKDINPSNLIWNSGKRLLQLIDFGIASELGQETTGISHPNTLEGTLRYMAPEQTGRMNRIVDYRADYYAVGATFYELLAGQPPFAVTDAMELVHCHIARAPDWTLLSLKNLPGPLLQIVQRLLEKNAEQRYQSIQGLKKDLELCRAIAQQPVQQPAHFTGLTDHSGKFLIPQKLYGREGEVEVLLAAFERISDGPAEMLLVGGYSGIGKSALINEVHKPIVARRGCFVSGKFDQYRRDIPYASLIQAFQELIRQLLSEPEAQLQSWAAKLHNAMGANLGVMAELIPELALIVGSIEPVAELPPVESQNRLSRSFLQFVGVFSAKDHPLVIFLDDLQWADAPTLRIIEQFMRDASACHLLFIGAYRDNEVSPAHPLMSLCDTLHTHGAPLHTLMLAPLTEHNVAQLNADALRVSMAECAPLTRLCYQKTRGNPFFLNQFLQTIHEAGHLTYRFDQNCWQWDMQSLERTDYTHNVVELMLEKIRRLPLLTQHIVQLAASLGNRFELETLAVISERTSYQAQQDLWPALKAGLIHPLDHSYKYLEEEEPTTQIAYRFLHDRVQQAAYAVVDEDARRQNHLCIGRLLLRHATSRTLEDQLFAVVEQLNAGRDLIQDGDERLQLAALNHRAGGKASGAAAFQAALRYMRTGVSLLPDSAPLQHIELYLNLQLGVAESAYLCGEFAAAEAIYPLALAHCITELQKVRCLTIQAHQYQLQGRLLDAISILRKGLALLQIDIPGDDAVLQANIPALFADTDKLCAGRSIGELLIAEEMSDPVSVAAMRMMQGLWMASYYAGQQNLSMTMILSMTRLSLQKGNSDFTSVGYVGFAFSLAIHTRNDERSYQFGAMSLDLAKRRTNLQARSLTCLMFAALVNHWSRSLRSCDVLYEDALNWALESGDFVQVGVVAAVRATDRLIMGQYLPDLLQSAERDLVLMRANGQMDMVDCSIAGAVQAAKCLMGLTPDHASYDDDSFSEQDFLASYGHSRLFRAYFLQGKIRNAYLFDSADAEALAEQLEVVTQLMRGQAKVAEATFYAALICIRALRRAPQRTDATALLTRISAMEKNLAAWAVLGPDNVSAKHLLMQAECARYREHMQDAIAYYQQAIDSARDTGYINIQALANELCGEFWLEQGQQRIAEIFLQDALTHYRQWGAEGKATQLAARYDFLKELASGRAGTRVRHTTAAVAAGHTMLKSTVGKASITTVTNATSVNATLDLASIVKASHALSNEIGLRNVLQRLIAIVRENSGAQVARLLLLHDDIWRMEADISGDTLSVLQARHIRLDADSDSLFPLSLLRYVIRSGAEVIEDRIAVSPRFALDAYVQAHQPKSVMCLPIKQGGRVSGMLYLENNLAEASFTAERVEFLRILGGQAMISISHARLHDSLEQRVAERTAQLEEANHKLATLSATDGLTGLANRRRFDEALASEWSRATRTQQPLAVIMIDVDHFKKYNDCYGHQAGDECLKTVARVLQEGTRRISDLAARYGGEEFSIVLPNTEADVAHNIAESMRYAIEALNMRHEQSPLGRVTVSIGVALKSTGYSGDAEGLVRAADEALYQAKDQGRNCVVLTAG